MKPVLLLCLLLLSSCGLFRPSAERQCRKAEGYIAKAVRICPEAASLRTETHTIDLPGDSSRGDRRWTDADLDSVSAACEQLREALVAERQVADIINDGNAGVIIGQQQTIDSLLKTTGTRPGHPSAQPLARLRAQLCQWPDILDSTDLHILRIRYSPSGPLYTIEDRPRRAQVTTAHQPIIAGPVNVQESINGWLVAGTASGWLLALVFFLMFKSERHLRMNGPHKP